MATVYPAARNLCAAATIHPATREFYTSSRDFERLRVREPLGGLTGRAILMEGTGRVKVWGGIAVGQRAKQKGEPL